MKIKKILKITTIMTLFAIIFILPMLAHADVTVDPNAVVPEDPWEIFQRLVAPALLAVGVIMIIFGAIEMGFAFHSDEAEKKRKGFMVSISGVVLFLLCAGVMKVASLQTAAGSDIPAVDDVNGLKGPQTVQMRDFLSNLGTWIPYLGFICMFWGIFELAKSLKSDDAAGKQKALTIIIAGVCLWQIINLMNWILGWGIA